MPPGSTRWVAVFVSERSARTSGVNETEVALFELSGSAAAEVTEAVFCTAPVPAEASVTAIVAVVVAPAAMEGTVQVTRWFDSAQAPPGTDAETNVVVGSSGSEITAVPASDGPASCAARV